MVSEVPEISVTCACLARPAWARIEDDTVMRWPVAEIAEWEELRHCPDCGRPWLTVWPEEVEGVPVLCRPQPDDVRRIKDVDHARTMRKYCLAKLEEHLGALKEHKLRCKKVDCERKRVANTHYCVEHLIAQRFGRHWAMLDRDPQDITKQ